MVSEETKRFALRVAEDICMFGHFKGEGFANQALLPTNPCCLFWNATSLGTSGDRSYWPVSGDVEDELIAALGFTEGPDLRRDAIYWSDNTPTEEVVAKLREIAGVE